MSTRLSPGVETVEDTRTSTADRLSTGDGDHERFAHFVPREKLVEAMVNGTPVVALCGKVWVPSRDPGRYQVCPTCQEILDAARAMGSGE